MRAARGDAKAPAAWGWGKVKFEEAFGQEQDEAVESSGLAAERM